MYFLVMKLNFNTYSDCRSRRICCSINFSSWIKKKNPYNRRKIFHTSAGHIIYIPDTRRFSLVMAKLENMVCTSAKGEFDSINKSDQWGERQWEQCWEQWERSRGLTGREWEEGEECSGGAGANTAVSHFMKSANTCSSDHAVMRPVDDSSTKSSMQDDISSVIYKDVSCHLLCKQLSPISAHSQSTVMDMWDLH